MRIRRLAVLLGLSAALPVYGGTVSGRVADSKGNPVTGARVVWYAFRQPERVLLERMKGTARVPLGESKTDAGGSFKVTFEKPSEGISLEIVSKGLPSLELDGPYDTSDESLDLDILLPEVDRIAGRIIDEAGQPLDGARVRAAQEPGETEAVAFAEGASQADGKFVFENAPKGAVLRVDHAGFVPLRLYASRSGSSLLGILKRGGVVEGRVLDAAGQPVAGAIVVAGSVAAETDAQGLYRLANLAAAPASLVVTAKNDLVARRDSVIIRRGEATHVDLTLSRAAVIAGSVVDARTRRPVAGARIVYSESTGPWALLSGRSVRADSQGRFRVSGLLTRMYQVTARRRDYVATTIPGIAAAVAKPATVAFALQRSFAIPGRAVDERGAPVPGARISLLPVLMGRRSLLQGFTTAVPATVTAADGSFRLRGVAPDPAVSIEARKPTYVTTRRHGLTTVEGDSKPVSLTMRRGLDARGSVVDSQNEPIAGVELRLQRRQRAERSGTFQASGAESASPVATSDPQGRLVATGLEAGDYSGRLTREGFASKAIPLLEVRAEGATVWSPFVLESAAPISGSIRNRKGEPVAGAQVSAFGGDVPSRSSMTDMEGLFRLDGYPRGASVSVSVSAEGYARAQSAATAPTESVAIVLSRNGEIRGRVEDLETKEPIEAFSVGAGTPRSSNMRYLYNSDFRSPDGSFILATVPPGKVEVTASAPGYLEAAVTALEIGEGETREGLVLSLKKGREMNGRVIDPARGAGVPGAVVSWRREHETSAQGFMNTSFGTFLTVPNSTTTDADGRFHYEGLPPERLAFSATHADYLEASKTVDAGSESSIDLMLSLGGAVGGTVVERDGRTGVPGAEVSIEALGESGASWRNDATRTDASGRFRFEHLKEGRFRVNARADSGRSPVHDLVLGQNQLADDVLLQLAGGARVRGRVSGLPSGRLGGVAIVVSSQDFQNRTSTSDDGSFLADDVPSGPLRVSASTGSPGRIVAKSAEVPDGASEITVDVVFEAGSRLSGRVTRSDRGVPGLWVSAAADPASATAPRAVGRTDGEGRYELEGLSDGAHRLQLSGENANVSRPLTISGDTTFDVALGGGRIFGVVTDAASGDPLQDAGLRAERGPEGAAFAAPRGVTDSRGSYAIEDLETGTYQVTVQHEGYQQKTQTVAVGETSAEANFSLSRGSGVVVTVTDGITGLPLKGLDVVALASGSVAFRNPIQLDANGRGEISALAPGRYALHLFSAGYAPRLLASVDVPSPPLNVSMTPGGRVEARAATGVSGKIYTVAGALCLRSPWSMDGTVTASPPVTALGRFEPGAYRLVVSGPGSNKSYPFTVTEGQTTTVTIGD